MFISGKNLFILSKSFCFDEIFLRNWSKVYRDGKVV